MKPIKMQCPVCNRTMGYIEVPTGGGVFRTKCMRCKAIIRIDLGSQTAIKTRLAPAHA